MSSDNMCLGFVYMGFSSFYFKLSSRYVVLQIMSYFCFFNNVNEHIFPFLLASPASHVYSFKKFVSSDSTYGVHLAYDWHGLHPQYPMWSSKHCQE